MKTTFYSNLAHSLISKISNMKDAGIIDDFNASLWASSNESVTNNSFAVTMFLLPYGMKYFHIEEGEENIEEKIDAFNKELDDLIREYYGKVSVQRDSCTKIEENFKDIISQ